MRGEAEQGRAGLGWGRVGWGACGLLALHDAICADSDAAQ